MPNPRHACVSCVFVFVGMRVECSGGLELLFGNQKELDISVPAPPAGATMSIRHVLAHLKVSPAQTFRTRSEAGPSTPQPATPELETSGNPSCGLVCVWAGLGGACWPLGRVQGGTGLRNVLIARTWVIWAGLITILFCADSIETGKSRQGAARTLYAG